MFVISHVFSFLIFTGYFVSKSRTPTYIKKTWRSNLSKPPCFEYYHMHHITNKNSKQWWDNCNKNKSSARALRLFYYEKLNPFQVLAASSKQLTRARRHSATYLRIRIRSIIGIWEDWPFSTSSYSGFLYSNTL